MSVLVAGLCYEIPFGCPKRKAVAVALADHASHDGTKVFPAIALIARKVEFSERTVQRTLRDLEALGVLIVVSEGGAGPKSTREWAFDMDLLRRLASGESVIPKKGDSPSPLEAGNVPDKGDRETPLKGDSLSPLEAVRVTNETAKGDNRASKGDTPVTRTVTNHQLEPTVPLTDSESGTARESAVGQFDELDLKGKGRRPSIKPDLIQRAASVGLDVSAIEAEARQVWPDKPSRAFGKICSKQIGDRLPSLPVGVIGAAMKGDAAALARITAELRGGVR